MTRPATSPSVHSGQLAAIIYIRVQDAEYLDYLDYLAVTLYRCRIYLDYLAVTPLQLGSNFSHFVIMDQNCVKENYIFISL